MKPRAIFIIVGMAILTGGFLFVDVGAVFSVVDQHQSAAYPSTVGTVYHSGVTVTHSRRASGTTYTPNIFYRYEVNGQSFHNHTLRYSEFHGGSAWADATVRAHPEGSEVTVYYRPDDPQDSLLNPGTEGGDLFGFFLLAPITIWLLYWSGRFCGPSWYRYRNPPAGGAQILTEGSRTRLRLPRYSALFCSLVVFSLMSAASFLTVLIAGLGEPSVQMDEIACGLTLAVTGVEYARRRAMIVSGMYDVVIDQDARTFSLPPTYGRDGVRSLEFDRIESICVEAVVHRLGLYNATFSWAVVLKLHGSSAWSETVTDWSVGEKSLALAEWLRERIHLPEPANQLTAPSSAFSLSSRVG